MAVSDVLLERMVAKRILRKWAMTAAMPCLSTSRDHTFRRRRGFSQYHLIKRENRAIRPRVPWTTVWREERRARASGCVWSQL